MDLADPRTKLVAHREDVLRTAYAYGAHNVRVFGSTARGEPTAESDIDLLVTMAPGRSLLDLVGLAQDLERLLGCPVDVISDHGLSPHLRDRILVEAVAL